MLVVAVLHLAAELLIPIALAALLAFLLSPLVVWLTRRRVPKILAISGAVALVFAFLGGLGWVVLSQTASLAERLPDYEENIRVKIERVGHPERSPAFARTKAMIEKLRSELEAPGRQERAEDVDKPAPLPVRMEAPSRPPFEIIGQLAGPVLGPLGMAGVVIVLVVAMLFQRDDLRDRFIKIVSAGRLNLTTQAMDDAARRVTRYLFMQLMVNAAYGVPVGLALACIGVPNSLLWGLLATLLRFIPFLGPWVAAFFPVALAMAVDPGWGMVLATLAVFLVMELVSNNIIEVKLYGASTGISNLALLLAAVFWTWLWGTAGLFLSTPLTVCLLVLGRHVPGLKVLHMLLGSGPVLEPREQFYQRMLAMDFEEMLDLARRYVAERSLPAFYDDVFLPALRMAEQDREEGTLAEVRQKFIIQAGRELIEEIASDVGAGAAVQPGGPPILGMPAHDDADELAALMLAHLLAMRGLAVEVLPLADATGTEAWLRDASGGVVFVSALPPSAATAARRALRRVRRQAHEVRLLAGVWEPADSRPGLESRLGLTGSETVATSLGEAAATLARLAGAAPGAGPAAARAPASHGPEERALEEWFEHLVRELAQVFDVPLSLVSLVDRDPGFWKERAPGLPALAKASEAAKDEALCGAVLAEGDLLVVENVTKDRRLAENGVLAAAGVRFYAGAALRLKGGRPVGVLCVGDTTPRTAPAEAVARLREAAAELTGRLEGAG